MNETIKSHASKTVSAIRVTVTSLVVAALALGAHSRSSVFDAPSAQRGDVANTNGSGRRRAILEWADVLEVAPDPKLVDDEAIARIRATGLPWRVRHKKSGIEMLLIPSGKYICGACAKDVHSKANEEPRHEVTISKAFYVGRCEVTQAQWMRAMQCNPSHFDDGGDLPVECVSWNDIDDPSKGFLARCGGDLRLPTEGEWEYACRAGGRTIYSDGNTREPLLESGWFIQNSGSERLSDEKADEIRDWWEIYRGFTTDECCKTHAVGQKDANAWGLCDMHGNVAEWCSDWYSDYTTCSSCATDPAGDADGTFRVVRGGAWDDFAEDCSSSHRGGAEPGHRSNSIGFRVARTP